MLQAIEYAIDKGAIGNGPGQGLYTPLYQIISNSTPDYNAACAPRKYDPAKANKLQAEAEYPLGFSLKFFILDSTWKDGVVAVKSYQEKVGIEMDIQCITSAA